MLFCELHSRVLGGIQLGLLVEVPLCEIDGRVLACSLGLVAREHPAWAAGGGAALRDWRPGAGMQFGALVDAVLQACCCFASLTVLGGIHLGLLVEVPLCEVLGSMQFGVLVRGRVLGGMGRWWRCRFARLAVGCWWMLFCEFDGRVPLPSQ